MKPLTRKKRTASLLALGLLFAIAAPIILLYSFGYRLGSEFTLQKTGGIFIHSTTANASVFIDGEYIKDSGIFLRNTLIQDLTPDKEYTVEVSKDGFQSWTKNIFVYPSIVSEGRVLLLPNEFELREIFKYINSENIGTSTSPSKKIVKSNNLEYILVTDLFAVSTSTVSIKPSSTSTVTTSTTAPSEQKSELQLFFESLSVINFDKLPNLIIEGKEVSWLSNGDISLYWTDDVSSIPYYYCGGLERVCENKIIVDWQDPIKRFDYFPGRNDVWIILVENGIYAVEVDGRSQRNIQKIYEGKDLDFRLTGGDQLIIQEGSKLFEIKL